MLNSFWKQPVNKLLLVLMVLLTGVLALTGCSATRGAVARGWPGGVIEGEILYTGTMDGNIASVNITDGRLLMSVPLEAQEASGGILGCVPVSSSVVMYGSPVIAGDLICVAGHNGKVYAFPVGETREEPRWVYPRQGSVGNSIIGGVIYDKGKLFFGSANNIVYSLDAADGYKEWEYDIGEKIWSTPAILDDTVYIGSFDNKLYALDAAEGTKKWEYETGGAVISSPVATNGMVYFSSFDRKLYALDAASGAFKWEFPADRWFWAKPVIYEDIIYVPCLDGKVYALDTASGEKLNEFDLGSPISSSPALIGDVIVIATQGGGKDGRGSEPSVIYSIEAGGTRQNELVTLDENEKVFAPIIAGDGKAFIHTSLDKMHEVDVRTGAEREVDIKEE